MVNLAQLLFKSARNNRSLVYGNQKFLTHGEAELFGDDQEEMYFEATNWLRLALSMDDNLPDANYLLGLFYEQGLSVD